MQVKALKSFLHPIGQEVVEVGEIIEIAAANLAYYKLYGMVEEISSAAKEKELKQGRKKK